jgi:hypothetical protein
MCAGGPHDAREGRENAGPRTTAPPQQRLIALTASAVS